MPTKNIRWLSVVSNEFSVKNTTNAVKRQIAQVVMLVQFAICILQFPICNFPFGKGVGGEGRAWKNRLLFPN